jgi:hypothetical protein
MLAPDQIEILLCVGYLFFGCSIACPNPTQLSERDGLKERHTGNCRQKIEAPVRRKHFIANAKVIDVWNKIKQERRLPKVIIVDRWAGIYSHENDQLGL